MASKTSNTENSKSKRNSKQEREQEPITSPVSRHRKNEKGGVFVDPQELQAAFAFFDATNKGFITKQDLKEKVPLFYKNVKPTEYQYLMSKKTKLTFDELYDLLCNNELTDFDPVAEAFQFYDPDATGFVQPDIIKELLQGLGQGNINDEDLAVLINNSDVDGDGKISLEDFRKMIEFSPVEERPRTAPAATLSGESNL